MAQMSSMRRLARAADVVVVDGLMALSRAVVALTSRSLSEVGAEVTLTQYRTLVVLASRGPQRVADLAAELAVQPSTVSRLCDRLVARGVVGRQHGQADRRVVWIRLTAEGKELVGQVMSRRRDLLAELVAQVSIGDPKAFAREAERIAAVAGEQSEKEWWAQWERSGRSDDGD